MLTNWIRLGKERAASDLHLEAGSPVIMRVQGELGSFGEPIAPEVLLDVARSLLGDQLWQEFLTRRSADLSRTLSGIRCRIHVFQTVRGIGLAIRLLSSFQNNIRDCNLHPDLKRLVEPRTGLVIISGSTGSGKSTTMAAFIEELNAVQRRHIITVESPIEYFFTNKQSFIRQREVPNHTPSFEQAIVDAMREDPDVLVIGEMRTPDIMRLTLNAAETGHLVLATMHSSTCAEAIGRICMSFPSEIQGSIRAQLADCLVGVVCQRLTYLPKYQIRVPVAEVLLASSAAKSNIRTGQFSQLISVIQTAGEEGMWSFDRYQRWVDQRGGWTKPSQATPLESKSETDLGSQSLPELQQPLRRSVKKEVNQRRQVVKQSGGVPLQGDRPSSSGRIEIDLIEDDLEELARQITKDGDPDEDSDNEC